MTEVSTEAVKTPAHENVELPAFRVGHGFVERGAFGLRPAHALVGGFDCRPAARLRVAPKLLQLILGFLLSAADASIDGTAHRTMLPKPPLDSQQLLTNSRRWVTD